MILCPPSTDSNCVRKMSSSCPAPNVFLTNFAACSIRIQLRFRRLDGRAAPRFLLPESVKIFRSAAARSRPRRMSAPRRAPMIARTRCAHLTACSLRQMLLRRRQIFRSSSGSAPAVSRRQQVFQFACQVHAAKFHHRQPLVEAQFPQLRRASRRPRRARPPRPPASRQAANSRKTKRTTQLSLPAKFAEQRVLDREVQPFIAAQQRGEILPSRAPSPHRAVRAAPRGKTAPVPIPNSSAPPDGTRASAYDRQTA